jgi:hypothetical protein
MGGLIHGRSFVMRHKQVSHKQGNKRELSSDYWAYINWGTYIRGGLILYIRVCLYSRGRAYIWNEESVSSCGGRWAYTRGGGLIFGGGGL